MISSTPFPPSPLPPPSPHLAPIPVSLFSPPPPPPLTPHPPLLSLTYRRILFWKMRLFSTGAPLHTEFSLAAQQKLKDEDQNQHADGSSCVFGGNDAVSPIQGRSVGRSAISLALPCHVLCHFLSFRTGTGYKGQKQKAAWSRLMSAAWIFPL